MSSRGNTFGTASSASDPVQEKRKEVHAVNRAQQILVRKGSGARLCSLLATRCVPNQRIFIPRQWYRPCRRAWIRIDSKSGAACAYECRGGTGHTVCIGCRAQENVKGVAQG